MMVHDLFHCVIYRNSYSSSTFEAMVDVIDLLHCQILWCKELEKLKCSLHAAGVVVLNIKQNYN
jgi:hypothetical protein